MSDQKINVKIEDIDIDNFNRMENRKKYIVFILVEV